MGVENKTEIEDRIRLLEALLATSPSASDLRWTLATAWESRGNAALKRGDVEEALAAYRECVEAKAEAVATVDAQTPDGVAKRALLAANYVGIATLERATGRFAEARSNAEAAIRTLEGTETGAEIWTDARALLAALDEV